jgi:hypothetical protein
MESIKKMKMGSKEYHECRRILDSKKLIIMIISI